MPDHVVLVVHGVGEQRAGESVQELAGAACTALECTARPDTDCQLLAETGTERDLLRQFPCHTAEITLDDGRSLTFAEVYWADLSPAPKGAFSTVFDLFAVVLGLGYLALDNVQNNLRADRRTPVPNRLARGLTDMFVWMFYALIAPINAFLFFGSVALLIDPYVIRLGTDAMAGEWSPSWVLGGLGALVTVAGALARSASRSYLPRCFYGALYVMGALTLAFGLISYFDIVSDGIFALLCEESRSWRWSDAFGTQALALENMPRLMGNPELDCFVMRGVDALNLTWFAATIMVFVLFLIGVVSRFAPGGAPQESFNLRSIYLAICSAMMMFWLVVSVAFWAAFRNIVGRLQAPVAEDGTVTPLILDELMQRHFGQAAQSLSYVFSAIVVLALIGLVVVVARFVLRERLQDGGPAQRFLGRALLNPILNIGLFLAILPVVFGVVLAFTDWLIEVPVCGPEVVSLMCTISNVVEGVDPFVYAAVAALGLGIYSSPQSVAAGLGVGRDIVMYSTRATRANPSGPDGPAAPGAARPARRNVRAGYPTRHRIEDRFDVVYDHFTKAHPAARVTVISHSQGTVISARGLDRMDPQGGEKPYLVTMGSPLTHIYQHYFSRDFTFGDALTRKLAGWTNIYRKDDFIGMEVTAGTGDFVQNHPIAVNGHSGYWRDTNAWAWLKPILLRSEDRG